MDKWDAQDYVAALHAFGAGFTKGDVYKRNR